MRDERIEDATCIIRYLTHTFPSTRHVITPSNWYLNARRQETKIETGLAKNSCQATLKSHLHDVCQYPVLISCTAAHRLRKGGLEYCD